MKILILTLESDPSSDEIIDWITFYLPNSVIKRCNHLEEMDISDLNQNNIILTRKFKHFILEERKDNRLKDLKTESRLRKILVFNTKMEISSLFKFIIQSEKHTVVGNREIHVINKLQQLNTAKKNDLSIPKWLITDNLLELKGFYEENQKSVISKPLTDAFMFNKNGELYASYTNRIDEHLLNRLPKKFPLSFFQNEIDKLFEIRTFYFYGKCYSMAIWSSENPTTEVDYRNSNHKNYNRRTPYSLDLKMVKKIRNMMKELRLNTGSIDFIYSSDGSIYFLEVNPEGQFGMVSKPCNYYLEKEIALKISHEYNFKQNQA